MGARAWRRGRVNDIDVERPPHVIAAIQASQDSLDSAGCSELMKLSRRQLGETNALDELERRREVEVAHAYLDRVRGAHARQLERSPHAARLAEAPLLPVLVHQVQ